MTRSCFITLRRFFAFIIDATVVLALLSFVSVCGAIALLLFSNADLVLSNWSFSLYLLLFIYFLAGDSGILPHGTVGKNVFALKVIFEQKTRVPLFLRQILRSGIFVLMPPLACDLVWWLLGDVSPFNPECRLLSANLWIGLGLSIAILIILPISILVGKTRHGIHDLLSQSAVVSNTETAQKFPVRKFSNTIKSLQLTSLVVTVLALIFVVALLIVDRAGLSDLKEFENDVTSQTRSGLLTGTKSGVEKIFPSVPRKYETAANNDGDEFYRADIRHFSYSRKTIGSILHLPEEVRDSVLGYNFSSTYTQEPLNLVDPFGHNRLTIPKGAKIMRGTVFVNAHGYNTAITRLNIALGTMSQMAEHSERGSIMGVKIVRKVGFANVSIEFHDTYYLVKIPGPVFKRAEGLGKQGGSLNVFMPLPSTLSFPEKTLFEGTTF